MAQDSSMLMEKFSSREWYNRVDDHLIIGALPFKSMAQLLVEHEVTVHKRKMKNELV